MLAVIDKSVLGRTGQRSVCMCGVDVRERGKEKVSSEGRKREKKIKCSHKK